MKTESHSDLVVFDSLLEAIVFAVPPDVLVLVDSCEYFQEGEHGHVSQVSVLRGELNLVQRLFKFELVWIRELPDE